jgi:hypothetical protein
MQDKARYIMVWRFVKRDTPLLFVKVVLKFQLHTVSATNHYSYTLLFREIIPYLHRDNYSYTLLYRVDRLKLHTVMSSNILRVSNPGVK